MTVLAAHADVRFVRGPDVALILFFAISGYLITSLLLLEFESQGRLHLWKYYGRRALRLLPVLTLVIASVVALALLLPEEQDSAQTLRGLPAVCLYVGNWTRAFGGDLGYLSQTWSLAVEEQFYIVWPLIMLGSAWLGARRGLAPARVVMWVALAGALLSFGLRVVLWEHGGVARVYNGSDTNAQNLLFGCALAAFLHHYRESQAPLARLNTMMRGTFPLALGGLLLVVAFEPRGLVGTAAHGYHTVGSGAVAVASAVVVAYLVGNPDSPASAWLARPLISYLGRISYGLYLWHYPVMLVLRRTLDVNPLVAVTVGSTISVALAVASWRLLEQPIQRRYRKHLVV